MSSMRKAIYLDLSGIGSDFPIRRSMYSCLAPSAVSREIGASVSVFTLPESGRAKAPHIEITDFP